MAQTTFKNLLKLKEVQKSLKDILGKDYQERIQPFVDIITKVMEANNKNEFESLKLIKEHTSLYKKEHAPMFFSAALVEITEAKNFADFKE